ncbi:MAG: hypothetical protein ABIH26_15505 [Candidatus Eisenbacteria bacterium]
MKPSPNSKAKQDRRGNLYRFSDLSKAEQILIRAIQRLGFGNIHNLSVRDGTPVASPPPEVIQDIKLGTESSGIEAPQADFVLKSKQVNLIKITRETRNGVLHSIVVSGGLPVHVKKLGDSKIWA